MTVAAPGAAGWRSRATAVSLVTGSALAAVLLYYSLRGIEWRQVARTTAHASPVLLLVMFALASSTLALRALRWRVLLNAQASVPFATAFWATAAGYFGNNFLPARAGELVRTVFVSSRSSLDKSYVLATALSERVADAAALVGITALVLFTLPSPPAWIGRAAKPIALIGLMGAAALAFLPLMGPVIRWTISRVPLPHGIEPRLIATADRALEGVRAFHDVRRLSSFLLLTAIIWCVDALGAIVCGAALGMPLPLAAAFLLIVGLSVGTALPSTPGYIGIYQFVAVTVLAPFGFSRTGAIAYILVAQALSYLVIGSWGAAGLWRWRKGATRG